MSQITSSRDLPPSLLRAARLVGYTPLLASTSDPRVSYALYIPPQHYDPDPLLTSTNLLPVVVAIHGTTRQTTPLLAAFQSMAHDARCAILAPLFPAGLNGPNDWDNYRVLRPGLKEAREGDVAVDTVLLDILDRDVPARWPGLKTERVLMAGFSGGASMAQRFCLLYPERVFAVSIAAPGSLTRLRGGGQWPEGLDDVAEVFCGLGKRNFGMVGAWQLVVGGDDTALEGSLEGLTRIAKGWREKGPSMDWEDLIRQSTVPRRVLLELFQIELCEEGIVVNKVEVVPGGKHSLTDVAFAMSEFLTGVLGKVWAGLV